MLVGTVVLRPHTSLGFAGRNNKTRHKVIAVTKIYYSKGYRSEITGKDTQMQAFSSSLCKECMDTASPAVKCRDMGEMPMPRKIGLNRGV